MSVSNPGGKRWWRNGWACECMVLSIEDIIEPRLREAGILGKTEKVTVFQYAYNTSVSASGNTHAGGGVIDHRKGSDKETIIWRQCGVGDYQRGTPEDNAFSDHNHGIWQGCPHTSDAADRQLVQYRNNQNGLANHGPDQSPNVPPITWQEAYEKYSKPAIVGGILGMTDVKKFITSKGQLIPKDGEWHVVKINDEGHVSLVTAPKDVYLIISCLTVSGLPAGNVLQLRFNRVFDYTDPNKPTTIEGSYPVKEIFGSAGNSFDQIVWADSVGDNAPGAAVKEAIRLYALAVESECTIAKITSRVLH